MLSHTLYLRKLKKLQFICTLIKMNYSLTTSLASKSQFFSSSILMTSALPFDAAQWSGALPYCEKKERKKNEAKDRQWEKFCIAKTITLYTRHIDIPSGFCWWRLSLVPMSFFFYTSFSSDPFTIYFSGVCVWQSAF